VAALGAGALAFFLVRHYLSSQEQKIRHAVMSGQERTERVVVARRSLEAGAIIGPETMAIGEIPKRHLSARAVLPSGFNGVQKRVLTRPMSAGEPLLADFVAGLLIERFSDLLKEGERAVSLDVTPLDSHAGMLVPGDYIDLFALVRAKPGTREQRMIPLVERIKVLAAGAEPLRTADQSFQQLPEQQTRYASITVGVPVDRAEKLLMARQIGEVVYLLRNAHDADMVMSKFDREHAGKRQIGYRYYSISTPQGQIRRAEPSPAAPGADSDATAGE